MLVGRDGRKLGDWMGEGAGRRLPGWVKFLKEKLADIENDVEGAVDDREEMHSNEKSSR